jgi:hypothetical protein
MGHSASMTNCTLSYLSRFNSLLCLKPPFNNCHTPKESAGTLLLAIALKFVLYYTRISNHSCAATGLRQVAEDEPCATFNANKKTQLCIPFNYNEMVYLGALPNRSMRVAQVKAYTAGLY